MQLNDIEEKKVKNTVRKFAKVLRLAFMNKDDGHIGFYALLAGFNLVMEYLETMSKENDWDDFQCCKISLINLLTNFQSNVFKIQFNESEGQSGRH